MNNPNQHSGERTFKCADAGYKECNWQVSGHNDIEIMDRVKEHGRQAHGITNFDDNMRHKVQQHIHDKRAA